MAGEETVGLARLGAGAGNQLERSSTRVVPI